LQKLPESKLTWLSLFSGIFYLSFDATPHTKSANSRFFFPVCSLRHNSKKYGPCAETEKNESRAWLQLEFVVERQEDKDSKNK
jgi:hypothetical protein